MPRTLSPSHILRIPTNHSRTPCPHRTAFNPNPIPDFKCQLNSPAESRPSSRRSSNPLTLTVCPRPGPVPKTTTITKSHCPHAFGSTPPIRTLSLHLTPNVLYFQTAFLASILDALTGTAPTVFLIPEGEGARLPAAEQFDAQVHGTPTLALTLPTQTQALTLPLPRAPDATQKSQTSHQ